MKIPKIHHDSKCDYHSSQNPMQWSVVYFVCVFTVGKVHPLRFSGGGGMAAMYILFYFNYLSFDLRCG